MHKVKLFVILSLFMLVFAGVVSAQDGDSEGEEANCDSENPVTFGFVVDNSGVGVVFAESQFKGLDMAMEDINEDGGILGRCVEYIWQDAELDATKGATIAEQFVLEDEVDFLLGPTSSGVALAVTEVARENGVPVAFHTSNTVQLSTTSFHKYMVQLTPHTSIEARAAAEHAAAQGFDTWAAIGPDYSFGRDSFSAFQPRLMEENEDAEIVTEQWPSLGEADLVPYLTAIEANSPTALYSNLWGNQLVDFVQASAEFNLFDDIEFLGLFDTDALKSLGDDLPEGLFGYARAPFYAIDTEAMEAFNEAFFERHEEYPSDWAIMIYDSVMALAAAAEEAGSVEGDAVADAFDGLTFDALRGELTIRGCDHMANVGEYVGVTTQESEYGIPIMTDVQHIPAEELWDSCEDIEAMREEAEEE